MVSVARVMPASITFGLHGADNKRGTQCREKRHCGARAEVDAAGCSSFGLGFFSRRGAFKMIAKATTTSF